MSDEQLDPQAREVRRLLADARHDEPTPDAVVARLDKVLDDLAAEPARVRPVTDLATRRRRVTQLLAAAAAVVVLGVGISQVVQPTSGEDAATSGAAETADRDSADDAEGAGNAKHGDGNQSETASLPEALLGNAKSDRFTLRAKDFSVDASALQDITVAQERSTAGYMAYDSSGEAAADACRSGAWGKGTFVAVTYRRAPAVLVFRRAMGDTQVADLFLCGSTEPTRSVTLPAP